MSSTSVANLVTKSSTVDFALFIFTPDDNATILDRNQQVVRDNVLFEKGRFVGAIGKDRTFIIKLKPRNQEMYLPTDLLGLMTADYEANRSNGDLVSATNRTCSLIKAEVKRLGSLNSESVKANTVLGVNAKSYPVSQGEIRFLSTLLSSYNSAPEGLSFFQICNDMDEDKDKLSLAAIKLERLGYLAKTIGNDSWGKAQYHYAINELGIDILLESERGK